MLLDALRILRDRGVQATAVFVGTGGFRTEIEERRRSLGLTDVVELAGAVGQDEIAGYYRAPRCSACRPSSRGCQWC